MATTTWNLFAQNDKLSKLQRSVMIWSQLEVPQVSNPYSIARSAKMERSDGGSIPRRVLLTDGSVFTGKVVTTIYSS
jgi:hypothetical protein